MEEEGVYHMLARPSHGEYKEKGSKFLAYAYPVAGAEDIQDKLGQLKKQHYDARHHCYAYVLGVDGNSYRANDDGEPNHSAGDPILGQIRSHGLTNTLVVVVRYFGGTKLGVGGLVYAYKTAAETAIKNNSIIQKEVVAQVTILYGYPATNPAMRLVDEFGLHITAKDFGDACRLQASVKASLVGRLRQKAQLLADTGHDIRLQISQAEA